MLSQPIPVRMRTEEDALLHPARAKPISHSFLSPRRHHLHCARIPCNASSSAATTAPDSARAQITEARVVPRVRFCHFISVQGTPGQIISRWGTVRGQIQVRDSCLPRPIYFLASLPTSRAVPSARLALCISDRDHHHPPRCPLSCALPRYLQLASATSGPALG